jgi:hypothetical protein
MEGVEGKREKEGMRLVMDGWWWRGKAGSAGAVCADF